MARFAFLSLGIFLVLLVGAFVLAYFSAGSLINYYSQQIARTLNVNIDIRKSSVSGRTMILEGLNLSTRDGLQLARIDKVEAPIDPYKGFFFGTSRWISDIKLTHPELHYSYGPDGKLNWDSVTLPRRLSDGPLEMAYRGHIQVIDGALVYRDQRQMNYTTRIDGVNALLDWQPDRSWGVRGKALGDKVDFIAAAVPEKPIEVEAQFRHLEMDNFLHHPALATSILIEGASANGRLQLRIPPLNPKGALALGQLDLAARSVNILAQKRQLDKVSARIKLLGSALEIQRSQMLWRGQPIGITGQVRPDPKAADSWVRLRIKAGPLALQKLVENYPNLPQAQGQASVDVNVDGPLSDPVMAGRVTARNLEAPVPESPGQKVQVRDLLADFQLDSNSLHLKKVEGHTASGEPIHGRGWLFRDQKQDLYLRLSGGASELRRLSPLLAGAEDVQVTALGTTQKPVLTGQARLNSLPANPLGVSSGRARFWVDQQSALLYDATLYGQSGQVAVPRAVLDYHNGDLAAEAVLQDFHMNSNGASARVTGVAELSGNYKTNQLRGSAYLDNSQAQAPGLPPLDNVSGWVAMQDGQLLVPHLSAQSGGDRLEVTGSLQGQHGTFYVNAPEIQANRYLAGAPGGVRNLTAEAEFNGREVVGFRAASRGGSGDAYAVGRWLPGRSPEIFAQFVNLQLPYGGPGRGALRTVDGEVATMWENGRLGYLYGIRPGGASWQNWVAGRGTIVGSRLQMIDNVLHMPGALPTASTTLQGEGRAYSYFGPLEGPPLVHRAVPLEGWQSGGSLSFNGGFDLSSQRLYNLNITGRSLNLQQITSWFGPLTVPSWYQQLGVNLEEVLVDVDGRANGSLAAPQLTGSLRSPWTRLSRLNGDQLESTAFSWRADANLNKGQLTLLSLLSPNSMDGRLLAWKGPGKDGAPDADWLRSRLVIDKNYAWKGWIRAQAFPMAAARWLVPMWIADKLPSGVLSTQGDGLQIGGNLYEPQIAGHIDLKNGHFWTGYDHVPIDEAYVDFASNRRAIALSRFHLKSAGLTLEGRGNRTADGNLTGQLWADDLTLDTLSRFGFDTHGWTGTVDAAATLRDTKGGAPEAWVAVQGENLRSNMDGVFGIRRLVLGQVDRNLDGIPFTTQGKGIGIRLQGREVTVDLPTQGAEIEWDTPVPSRAVAHGQFSFSQLPKANQKPVAWLMSAIGPSFGNKNKTEPLKLEVNDFSWSLVKQLLSLEADRRVGSFTGNLELLGQYFEQHRVKNPQLTGKPLLTAHLEKMILEGPGAIWSGVQLASPMQLAYQVVPGAGWLHLQPTTFEFFHRVIPQTNLDGLNLSSGTPETFQSNKNNLPQNDPKAKPIDPAIAQASPQEVKGRLNLDASFVAMENPGAKKLASLSPDQNVHASLEEVDVQNLAFLFPRARRLGGTIQKIELTHKGALAQPDARFTMAAQNVQIGGLNITSAQGSAHLVAESPGRLQLTLGEGNEELRLLLGAENDLNQALRLQGQALMDFDRLLLPKSPTLVSSTSGWSLTDKSEFNLSVQLNDSQMRLLSAFAPDPERSRLSGNLKGVMQLKGTSANPELTGSLAIENGGFTHPDLSTPLTGLNMLANFERLPAAQAEQTPALLALGAPVVGRITLDKFDGNLGGQAFQGKGKAEAVGRKATFMDFAFDGQDLPIRWSGFMDGRANVHLTLTGKEKEGETSLTPFLSGRIELPQANLTVPDEESMAGLMALARGRSKQRAFDYDVDLSLGNDVFGNYLGSSIRGQGDLKITPSLVHSRPSVNGVLFLSRGVIRIPIYGINFRVRQGYAYFEDDFIPRLENLEADSTIGTYQITARFDGKYPNVHADLYANPPLPESDIRSIVGMGTLPGNGPYSTSSTLVSNSVTSPNGNTFLVNQGVSLLSNMLTQELTQGIGRLLFASEVSLDILPSSEYALRVAKSLNDKDTLLLTFAQAIGTTRFNGRLTQYGIEYRFQPNLLSRVTLNNYGQAQIWFQGVLRF
ncbi:MAG: translocation/assembly module TamB domain-containing protein [Candidatus Eremiobacteraeota bacterium]|nr:translocation/assembly module TamB domain-containing protein [Candidatus Eremiobacteraeota bacterium]MCW5868494.1 translocation/assembly module TamB domain-containing protein [Candidatus Eremiobacteraeota bacterium]